ncbi:hypothetical protein EGI11_03335 [Chryseobacterium sp. H3056]|uniref:Uncharacterized protein n=1 Tax=Kaistella daneshvariae TaxID=2487074 RepID=A0A3N0WXJ2_9FLAO|nr:hypothetical protein [Kaistella daneshvariae]ROI09804.1 hypothetical protein EGI11_03335 [Kaistella daneshvariae]
MAIIPKYTLAQKFENGKKPPEWDFWAWQDSYWHKEEKIPQTAIEDLPATLAKKADLENGMVREDQLPFSVVTSEVIALGAVEIVDNQVKLSVHSSGANKVRVKGQLITRAFPNQWVFTPVSGNGVKVIRGFAVKNQSDFFIAESDELPEMKDPEIPENALQIFRLIISSEGVTVDEGPTSGMKTKSQDNWTTSLVNVETPVALSANGSSSNFIVTKTSFAGSVTLKGIIIDTSDLWDGKEFYIKNEAGVDIIFSLATAETLPPEKALLRFTDLDLILKPDITALFRIFNGNLKPVKYSAGDGGGAKFPEAGADGDILEKDGTTAEGAKWSNRLTTAENALQVLENWKAALTDADEDNIVDTITELIATMQTMPEGTDIFALINSKLDKSAVINSLNSIMTTSALSAYQGKVLKDLIDGLNATVTANATALAGKADKPATDGIWSLQKLGSVFTWVSGVVQNIANTDLTTTANRTFTQGFTYTHATAGKLYYVTGLTDKTADETFRLFRVQNAAGQQAYVPKSSLYTTVEQKSISSTTINHTLAELNAYGTERVDTPNLNGYYLKVGFKWMFFTGTEVV